MPGQFREFLAYINKYGVAKTSHFSLIIPVVLATKSGAKFSDLSKVLGLRCEATELPGRQLVSNDSRTYGPTYKTPYQSVYQEITLNFLETSNFLIRDFFETWMSTIFDPRFNDLGYPKSYRYDTTLIQHDVSDGSRPNSIKEPETPLSSLKSIAQWTLYNSFPTAINQMPVAWSEDGLHRTTVTLAYEWYILATGAAAENKSTEKSAPTSPNIPPKGSAVS